MYCIIRTVSGVTQYLAPEANKPEYYWSEVFGLISVLWFAEKLHEKYGGIITEVDVKELNANNTGNFQ